MLRYFRERNTLASFIRRPATEKGTHYSQVCSPCVSLNFCVRMFWLTTSIRSVKLPAPSPAHFSPNLPPALLMGFAVCLLSALAILPADPSISVSESLVTLARLCIPAVVLSIVLCAVPSRSADQPPSSITNASSTPPNTGAREGYRCLFKTGQIQLIVTLACGRKFSVRVPRSASVDFLLAAVDKKRGISNTQASPRLLTSTGKELQRGCVLADYNLHSNALLSEVPDLRGGMQTTPTSSVHKAHAEAGV